jgi:hypothetical protein
MSSIERQLLASSLALVAAATGTLKAFGRALLQVGPAAVVSCALRVGAGSLIYCGSARLCHWLCIFRGGEYGRHLPLHVSKVAGVQRRFRKKQGNPTPGPSRV